MQGVSSYAYSVSVGAYKCHKRACPLQARAELRSNPAYVLPHAEVLLREAHDSAPAMEPRQQPGPGVLQAIRLRMQRKAIAWDLLIEVQRRGAVKARPSVTCSFWPV